MNKYYEILSLFKNDGDKGIPWSNEVFRIAETIIATNKEILGWCDVSLIDNEIMELDAVTSAKVLLAAVSSSTD